MAANQLRLVFVEGDEMDVLTFISKLVEGLAWPLVVAGMLLYLRKELPTILRSLRKLKFKDVEMEFGEAAIALAVETRRVMPPPKLDLEVIGESGNSAADRLDAIAELSPRAAILEAWLIVEASAADLIQKKGPSSLNSTPGPLRIKQGLRRAEVLTPPQEEAFEHLRRLRNEAVHVPDAQFTAAAVSSYIESALAMAAYLKDMTLRSPEQVGK
jgi:hypothetical protein